MKKMLSLLCYLFCYNAFGQANYLTLYFIHSPVGLNWETPQTLSHATLGNNIVPMFGQRRYSIGHVYVEYSCPRLNVHEYVGQTSIGSDEIDLVLKEKWGLGVMIANYKGILEAKEDVSAQLKNLYKNGRVSFLKILINESACERIVDYMQEYRELKLGDIYGGLHARPLYKEGSGCSAFGASFLEVSGLLLNEQYQSWTRHLGIPYKYIGGPRTGKEVNIAKLVLASNTKWTEKNDSNGFWIDFYDPDLMNAWVKDTHKKIKKGEANYPFATDSLIRNKAKGVQFDMTKFETPTGPIFRN